MYKICVFAGTTEGRELVRFLGGQPVQVTACVATEYGETLMPEAENLRVSARRLPVEQIVEMLAKEAFDLVIDATHPYASSITESICKACAETKTEHLRLLRKASELPEDAVVVPDAGAAAAWLEETEGTILLTTGSKELAAFSSLTDFADRVYARVLPMEESLRLCREAGLHPAHILALQGPFSEEMNLAMLRFTGAAWLVSKDGGSTGGFREKLAAARRTGVRMLVIGRPSQREGVSLSQTIDLLCRRFGCRRHAKLSILGIGPGDRSSMSGAVSAAIAKADCLIGAKRMLEAAGVPGKPMFEAVQAGEIARYVDEHHEYQNIAVLMSGDTGFYSGTKKLLPLLEGYETQLLPGLSSLSCLCARLKTSYEDVYCSSVHGRTHDLLREICSHRRVFALLGGEGAVNRICRSLREAGLGRLRVTIGERLHYPEEKIHCGTAAELEAGSYDALSVALFENETPDGIVTGGLPDSVFYRDMTAGRVVPMTKSEVRAVCLSKLQLSRYAVCWDVGAGSGSVALEMALQAGQGHVYAIERREEAAALIEKNREALCVENLTVVKGEAIAVLSGLPAPTHVFIGGAGEQLAAVLKIVLEKNPTVRIVAAAVTLETLGELTRCMEALPFPHKEVVSVQIARAQEAGQYHLMRGQNPVYLFTMQGEC